MDITIERNVQWTDITYETNRQGKDITHYKLEESTGDGYYS